MPTGYTAPVADGSVSDFPTFAMQCARAFGALITMRDEPTDAEVPAVFEPAPYYTERVRDAEARLRLLSEMSVDQQEAACRDEYAEAVSRWTRRCEDRNATRSRYEAMLERVDAWLPPTPEHVGLKDFMRKQIEESIRFDCFALHDGSPAPVKRSEWYERAMQSASAEVERARKALAEEVERCAGRTQWVADLRASLPRR